MGNKNTFKNVEIIDVALEKFQINIKFNFNNSPTTKHIWIMLSIFRNYFLDKHKQYGINETNVDDFINQKDAKYKLTDEDVQKFIFYYLYDLKEIEE